MTCTQQETQNGRHHHRALSPSLNKEDRREGLEVPVEQREKELEDTRTAADLERVWITTEEEQSPSGPWRRNRAASKGV